MNIRHLVSAVGKIERGDHKTVSVGDALHSALKYELKSRGRKRKQDRILNGKSSISLGGFTSKKSKMES